MIYLFMVLLVAFDQLTKYFVEVYLKSIGSIPIIKNILSFTYVENPGIAFGLFKNMNYIFIPLNIIITIAGGYFLYKFVKRKKILISWGINLIIAGAIGNIIDKLFRGYVVDFLQVKFINFPVFNVADMLVTFGTIIVAIYILFFDNGEKDDNKV